MQGKHLTKAFIASLLLIVTSTASAMTGYEFTRVSEFIESRPEQKGLMDSFSEMVRTTAKPLKARNSTAVKVAVIYPGVQSSDYWRRSIDAMEARMKHLNINYELRVFLSRPAVDNELQAEQLTSAIRWKADYLVYSADALNHRSAIQRILLKGKPKLILQNITTPFNHWHRHPPFLYTGFDHELGTLKLSERMLANQPEKYALLYFSPGYVSQMRGDTFAQEASQHPELIQTASYYTGGNRGKARAATEGVMKENPDLDMIFACSTDIALGAIDALRKLGKLETVLLNGWGGGEAELQALQKKELDITVMRMNDDASVAIAEAIKLDIQGLNDSIPQIYSGDMVILDQTTTADEVEMYKARAFRYSNKTVSVAPGQSTNQ